MTHRKIKILCWVCTGLFRGLGHVSPAARRWGKRLRAPLGLLNVPPAMQSHNLSKDADIRQLAKNPHL
jgi:hypothetical protein